MMRLTILYRLILGYIVLLVLAAGMSVYAVVQLGNVTEATHSIIFVDNRLLGLQKELTDALLSETRYEKKFLIVQDRAVLDGYQRSGAEFEHSLAEARALNTSPEVRAALNRVVDHHAAYTESFRQEVGQLPDSGEHERMRNAVNRERSVDAIIEELVFVRNLSQQNIFEKVKDLGVAGAQARRIAKAAGAVFLLLGVLLAVLITRSITRPLRLMQKKTREIAGGVFEADLQVTSPPEIAELAGAFNTMCSALHEVDRMKTNFYALMSHELRTPLTSIREGTNLFLEGRGGEVTEDQKKLLRIIAQESDRLIGLVSSVLDLSRLESGMLVLHRVSVLLGPLIERVVQEVRPLAEAKRIRIECSLGGLPLLFLDPDRMLQVIRNLVGNALKFTPRGGAISISASVGEEGARVSITDTGPGIPEEYRTAIFDKFRQVPGPGRLPGTGLGLAIVKHIMQLHGGTVWVESEPGNGSTFIFQVPA